MFLKEHHRVKDGKDHRYYSLCETIRTAAGPRHHTTAYLGELNSTAAERWRRSVDILKPSGEVETLSLFPDIFPNIPQDPDVVAVRLSGVSWERPRDFGDVYLGWSLWQQLGLDAFYQKTLDEKYPADVPWRLVAAILAINRLCAPWSELSIEERWYQKTALDNILGVSEEKVNTDRLYRCLDLLIAHKEELEQHLKNRYGELFGVTYDILLYDLTSTYFEGEAKGNPQAKRGYSRDHRPDCKQVVIALIVSQEGFPFAFEVFDGNRRDVTTLEEMLEAIEKKYGRTRRIWVFDRGVVSEKNLRLLRRRKIPYVVGTRRAELKQFEQDLLSKEWQKVREEVEVMLIPRKRLKETFVLTKSAGRHEKEKAMRERAMKLVEKGFKGIVRQVARGKLKDAQKVLVRIGKLLGRFPSVAKFYQWKLTPKGKAQTLEWGYHEEKKQWAEVAEGIYLLRTFGVDLTAEKLWEIYIQLTDVEAAFRTMKSNLLVRPIWHRKETRVQAHILVAFLGYALWVTLKQTLKRTSSLHAYDYDVSPAKAIDILSGIKSGDIILPTTDGCVLKLRRVARPGLIQQQLLAHLKIALPERLAPDQQM